MRFISYRVVLSVVIALAGLSLSACSDLSRQAPRLYASDQAEKAKLNHQDSDISNRLARVWMRVARQAMADGDPETAARFYEKAGSAAPTSVRPLLGLATAYERQGKQQEAADAFRTALRIDPANPIARISLGNMLVAQGKITEGIGILSPASAKRHPSPTVTKRPEDDIFSLISNIFRPESSSVSPPAPLPSKIQPQTQKLVIPVSAIQAETPPIADIAKTLSKIDPVARPDASPAKKQANRPAVLIAATARQTPPALLTERNKDGVAPPSKVTLSAARHSIHDSKPQQLATIEKRQYRIQLAAYRKFGNAVRGRRLLGQTLPARFPQMEVFVRQGHSSRPLSANFRLRSHAATSRDDAAKYCADAKTAGLACLVIRHTAAAWRRVDATSAPNKSVTRSADEKSASGKKTARTHRSVAPVAADDGSQLRTARHSLYGGSRYKIQLAAYRHLKNAIRGKQILARQLPEGFPGLDILKKSTGTSGQTPIVFRIRSSALWSKSHARKFCDHARATGISCLLIRHSTRSWRTVSHDRPKHASKAGTRRAPTVRRHLIATR